MIVNAIGTTAPLLYVCLPINILFSLLPWQDQRDRIIQRFRTGEIWVLICTDLMARGIDFKVADLLQPSTLDHL